MGVLIKNEIRYGGSGAVIDNLTTESPTKALSANQGKVLKTQIDALTAQMPNISAGTEDMTAGTSPLTTGDIYFVYE